MLTASPKARMCTISAANPTAWGPGASAELQGKGGSYGAPTKGGSARVKEDRRKQLMLFP